MAFLVTRAPSQTYPVNRSMTHGASPHDACSTMMSVKGVHRIGLIVDPGASDGLMGTDTMIQHQSECLWPRGLDIKVRPSSLQFSGIEGETTPGCVQADMPVGVPGLEGWTFTCDLIGGSGSFCPGLWPLRSLIKLYGTIFGHVFPNFDGILMLQPPGVTPVFVRLLFTDSGHYLLFIH